MKQKIFGTVLAALLAVCLLPAAALAEDPPTSGDFGANRDNLHWEFNKGTGVLTISGSGPMQNYVSGGVPWYEHKDSITKVDIVEGVTSIGNTAFEFCNSFNSITIPSSVTSIGEYAFYTCASLKSVTFDENSNLISIGERAFYTCGKLESVTFGANSKLESIGNFAFYNCDKLASITIPDSVTSIGEDVFYNCDKLESVTFGANSKLEKIGKSAFMGCTNLATIKCQRTTAPELLDTDVFYGCASNPTLVIPANATGYDTTKGWPAKREYVYSARVATIGGGKATISTDFDLPGVDVTLTATPDAGCYFVEWRSNDVEISGNSFTMPAQNVAVTAFFAEQGSDPFFYYSARVAAIGGGKATISTDFPYVGETVTLTATPDAGCYFVEWRSNDVVVSGNSFVMPNHDVVVTAVFAEYSSDPFFYMLKFETNGGNEIKTFTSEDVVTVNLADYKPTKEGYNFTGWYSDRDLTKKVTSVRLNADRTIYAGWEESKLEPEPTIKDCKRDNTCPAAQFTDLDLNAWYHDGIHYCLENGLMNGVENKIFAPNEPTNRAMIATILWRMEEKPVINYAMQFSDINADTWYGEAVRWAAGEGIINGYEDSTFKPDSNITREELAAVLFRYAEHKKADTANTADLTKFNDSTKVSPWAEDALKWAVASGIINGDEQNLLNPQGSATRAEVAAMLARLAESIAK